MEEQGPNLVYLTIRQNGKPTIKMISEAGLIGKIGLNSVGVGVCLNAIRIPGLDKERIPVHLGLRMVLDSPSRAEAVRALKHYGVASACHMLVADETGSIGLEWSSTDVQELQPNDGKILHTNHYCVAHPGIEEIKWLADSDVRLDRIEKLSKTVQSPSMDQLSALLQDESSYPTSICRAQTGVSTFATLFSIVMDLVSRKAVVKVGQPNVPKEVLNVTFDS